MDAALQKKLLGAAEASLAEGAAEATEISRHRSRLDTRAETLQSARRTVEVQEEEAAA